jgi:SAM-dependent methyltransferase
VRTSCPSCGREGMELFFEQDDVPSHSVLLFDTREDAIGYPRGSIRLGFCPGCGFIANLAVDPSLQNYSHDCEETQGFSPRFRAFADELARELVERHRLRGRTILEIGCGKAEFLAELCRLGDNRGIGIDPAAVPERVDPAVREQVELIEDYFSERYSDLDADVVVCRHTLEHIPGTGDFMRLIRASVAGRDDTLVFFELPDVLRVLREAAFWDIYYEHCSYFTPGSLARLFRSTCFRVDGLELAYEGQYILLEARPEGAGSRARPLALEESVDDVAAEVAHFRTRLAETVALWRGRLGDYEREGRPAVVWGSGSKGVAFLTMLGDAGNVEYVVDVNPHKHGRYMPGTGQEIVAPEFLAEYRPEVVIAMNPVYLEEIGADLERLGVAAELLAL